MPTSAPEAARAPLLRVEGLLAGYGKIRVLHGIDLAVGAGEVVTLLGPNGAGKTTLLRAISGLLPSERGAVHLGGVRLTGLPPRGCVRAGLAHVIEGHRVFTGQTVRENLLLAAYDVPKAEREARVGEALSQFPELAPKRDDKGASLSGGQQQMLAVAQGLVQRPRLLMLDEPSAGLSPVLVDRVLEVVRRLRAAGTAVLLVEQLVEKALAVSDRVLALAQGRIVLEARADAPDLPGRLERAYFGEAAGTASHPA